MKLLALLPCLLLVACSSSPHDAADTDAGGDAANDARTPGDGGEAAPPGDASAPDAPAVCNALANAAPAVPVEQVASDPPAAQGGTVVDGTYWLTAAVVYTGPSGPTGTTGTAQTTLVIHGSTVQLASSGTPATRTITLTTSGTSMDSVDSCPDTDSRSSAYTATATTLEVELDGGTDDAGARTLVETFTREP